MAKSGMVFPDNYEFYPEHPSIEKTHKLMTTPSPMLEGQELPFDACALRRRFEEDLEGCLKLYEDKRFDVSGTVISVEYDTHNLPSVQLSDKVGGECCVHCIFPEEDIMEKVKVGDRVVIRSNYLVLCNVLGIVMKYSELINIE